MLVTRLAGGLDEPGRGDKLAERKYSLIACVPCAPKAKRQMSEMTRLEGGDMRLLRCRTFRTVSPVSRLYFSTFVLLRQVANQFFACEFLIVLWCRLAVRGCRGVGGYRETPQRPRPSQR
jgi:hypothetical protein